MKKPLILTGLLVAAASFATATPLCVEGSLASYIALGSGGCQIDDKVFSSFTYQTTFGNGNAPSDEVVVAPLAAPPGGFLSPGPGLSFTSAGWTVSGPGVFHDAAITFRVSIAPGSPYLIRGGQLGVTGSVANGGLAAVGETIADELDLTNQVVLQSVLPFLDFDEGNLSGGPVRSILVAKDILVSTLGSSNAQAFAQITEVTQRFPQFIVPEPGTWALLGSALLILGVRRRR